MLRHGSKFSNGSIERQIPNPYKHKPVDVASRSSAVVYVSGASHVNRYKFGK